MGKAEYSLDQFWLGEESSILLNPRSPEAARKSLLAATAEFPFKKTIWLQSSGTESHRSGEQKIVALAKPAMLAAAAGVNQAFHLTATDTWLNCLPTFHVGGLSIYARAFLSGAKVCEYDDSLGWCPSHFVSALKEHRARVCSLVPTQVYDLVEEDLSAPEELRFVFVGGGPLNQQLYQRARQLAWPLLPSYGMTETSAQIATAKLDSLAHTEFPQLYLLPHIEAKTLEDGRLQIFSSAVASGVLHVSPKAFRWRPFNNEFTSDDRVTLDGERVIIHGREAELVKILGETVNLRALQETAEAFFGRAGHLALFVKDNARRGFDIYGAFEGEIDRSKLAEFNRVVEPYRRIKDLIQVSELPRNAMGKVMAGRLAEIVK